MEREMSTLDKQHLIKFVLMKIVLSKLCNNHRIFNLYFNSIRIALKCLDYQDKTLFTESISGSVALQLRLLNSLGYKCVPVCFLNPGRKY